MITLSSLPRSSWMEITSSPFLEGMNSVSSYWPTASSSWTDMKAAPTKIWDWVLSSGNLQLFLLVLTMVMFAYTFRPFLKVIMRRPLRKYIGMEFGDFKLSLLKLSLAFTDIHLSPVESPILQGLFAALFPSAIVRRYEESDEYPASKISIKTLKVGLRLRSFVGNHGANTGVIKSISHLAHYIMFQRPVISVKLNGVTLEVMKAYIAPQPPPEFHESPQPWPYAIPSTKVGPEIPTFDQDYILDFLSDEELRDANVVTFWIERWIQHSAKNMAKSGVNANAAKERTNDEKMNARIHSIVRLFCHSISIQMTDASIILSGAGSELVKETRKLPRDTNLILAKLPNQLKALTIIGTDLISISFSPDEQCNLLISLAGLHLKVGNPFTGVMSRKEKSAGASNAEISYAWHTIVHHFDVVIELIGIVPLIIWAVNYDHHWTNRTLGLNFSSTEIAVSLSPNHLHTVLLHLDDYTDPMSSFNEWYTWLNKKHQQKLKFGLDDNKKQIYCHNFARNKGTITREDTVDDDVGNGIRLTSLQMKEMESQMTRYEIMSLRCIAMKDGWRIPANGEFEEFLRNSQSSICEDAESHGTLDVQTPFQRLHPTPLHVLATLTREKNAFLAPGITINFFTKALHYDFPHYLFVVNPKESSTQKAVPSTLTLSNLSFELTHTNPLFLANAKTDITSTPRPLLSISAEACAMEWDVLDLKSANELDLPTLPNKSLVGIICKKHNIPSSRKVLRFDMKIAVAPTKNQDPLIIIDLWSSDLVITVNPLPLLSAIQTLIELSDLPFQAPEEQKLAYPQEENKSHAILSTNISINVKNTAILLMTDRKEISRGVFDLQINELAVKFQSCDLSGNLVISTVPITLHAGQIMHSPTSSDDAGIEWRLMPFKPVLLIDGGRLKASGKEKRMENNTTSHLQSLSIGIEICTDVFLVNASPSTLVALNGFISSLDPFLNWTGVDAEEEERIRLEKVIDLEQEKTSLLNSREVMRGVFNLMDVDESGTLEEEELERIVLMLFAEDTIVGCDPSHVVNGSQRLTAYELQREIDHLLSIIDSGHTNQVSYTAVDSILFRMVYGIDDNNLTPKIITGIDNLDRFAQSRGFLSAPTMRKLVYFDDFREYAAVREVYRITGQAKLENEWSFPPPSLWRRGEGINLFWDLYTSETGCTTHSLNGQNTFLVQRKLVRSLCNYEFAKFCWKALVQPQLREACYDGEGRNTLTCWQLDTDPQGGINVGVIDRLLRHIHQTSKDAKEKEAYQKGSKPRYIQYNISFIIAVDSAKLRFGSSHTFTKPLFEAQFSHVSINASAFLSSQTFWFSVGRSESEEGNEVHFQSTFSLMHLNTKHDHMEVFIEPCSCFGYVAYKTYLQDSTKHYDDNPKTTAFIVNINFPRSLNINALPSFFQAASILAKTVSQLGPETYCHLATDKPRKDRDNDEISSFDNAKKDLGTIPTRCYFIGQEIQLKNLIGRDLKVSVASDLYQSVDAGSTAAISINHLQPTNQSQMSLYIEKYKLIRGVAVSPYQSLMLPLIRHKKKPGGKRGRKHSNASGFSPHLTVVPKPDSLDSITLTVRPCVTIQAEIPIKIRIVRLAKLGYLKKKGTKQIDLTKKSLMVALKRLVEGALIVYEKDDINEGVEAPLPLNLLDSSCYHALLIQDLACHDDGTWRNPVLLAKDYLFNPMSIREVSRCHTLSGVVIQKERLNICLPNKHRNAPVSSDATESILRRTAWDTTIRVVPFFLLSNGLPFPVLARIWQLSRKEDDEMWRFLTAQSDERSISSDEDKSSSTPSINGKGANPDQFHQPSRTGRNGYFSVDIVKGGETLRLSGIDLSQPLFLQVSQNLRVYEEVYKTDFMWSKPLQIKLAKLRTGVNQNGSFALTKIPLDLGDNCDCLVDVSIERGIGMPLCTIYSPYWIMNKTGTKLEYKTKISGQLKHYLDSGSGGLPIMMHCGKSDRQLSLIPLECPNKAVALNWWDASSNGNLILKQNSIKRSHHGHHLVEWSKKIELDTAGTSGEIQCGNHVFSCCIESLAGAFYLSNLITIAPRFILKNMLHIPITMLPIRGSQSDAMRKASQLRQALSEHDEKAKLSLSRNDSTILYNFTEVSPPKCIEKSYRWVAFSVNAYRQRDEFKCKWHLIPIDRMDSIYFGEHDGFHDTMCGIVEAKVHGSDAARILSITHATVPPFQIENRSNDQYLLFAQDDEDGMVFELPPMHSCGYTWDSPLGRKRLRAVVVNAQNRGHLFEEAVKVQNVDDPSGRSINSNIRGDACFDNDEVVGELCIHSLKEGNVSDGCNKSVGSTSCSRVSSNMSHFPLKRRQLFGTKSRSYTMSKIGTKKNLPCPVTEHAFPALNVHLRVSAGTKIISFNDSPWLIEQVKLGLLRKGGDYKSALCNISIDGLSFYLMDDFPRELMGVIIRDVQIHKPMGSIVATAKVRHFQVDAMLPNARYPIIIQRKLIGVKRRGHTRNDILYESRPASVDGSDCFWLNSKKREPIFEIEFSYVPQSNMTWVPSIEVFVCPMKMALDVDYLLRVLGMVIGSISKYPARDHTTTTHANDELSYITYGQMKSRLIFIEKLYIAPVWFEVEINLKPDELDDSESALTLNSIARSSNSAAVAGVLSWVVNVGAKFAEVSPIFRYASVIHTDRYCDILELARDIALSYIVQSIIQSYKVIFSMQLLGDPGSLIYQVKTGISDLVLRTGDEIMAGGKDGFGKGIASFAENFGGGIFGFLGNITGGIAYTLDSLISNELRSTHLKPKLATNRRQRPKHAIEGLAQGTVYFGKSVVHGFAGLIGNPYRGAKTGTSITGSMAGVAKGVATGVTGLVAGPVIGVLGFTASFSGGIEGTVKFLELVAIEARCRPARMVPWGRPMGDNGLQYLKAIGIRVHTVRYQKMRKRFIQKDYVDDSGDDNGNVTSKEYKRIRAAEERRKNLPHKVVNILYSKENRQYVTASSKPKLLSDCSRVLSQDQYTVCFEETITLESSDLQLSDEVVIQFRNSKIIKSPSTRSKLSGICKLTVGDIYTHIVHFYREQLKDLEANLSNTSTRNFDSRPQSSHTSGTCRKSLIIPAPQEYYLSRPTASGSTKAKAAMGDIFEVIGEEISSIRGAALEALNVLDSDSVQTDSDLSFLHYHGGKKAKYEDQSEIAKANERLFGSISLSFFPVL